MNIYGRDNEYDALGLFALDDPYAVPTLGEIEAARTDVRTLVAAVRARLLAAGDLENVKIVDGFSLPERWILAAQEHRDVVRRPRKA